MQAGGLFGEHLNRLVQVAVRGGPGQAETATQPGDVRFVAEPGQRVQRLPPAGQQPGARPGTPGTPLGGQQSASSLDTYATSSPGTSSMTR